MAVTTAAQPLGSRHQVGELLRSWRQRRSLSQLELALNADVSSRHVSFLETGRARPSRGSTSSANARTAARLMHDIGAGDV